MRPRLPSPAMLVALLALFVALGGGAYAAATLSKNSVKAKQIAKNAVGASEIKSGAVGSSEVKNRSLKATDFASGQLPEGPKGDKGDKGDAGEAATKLFAEISPGATPAVLHGQGVVSVSLSTDYYIVTFDRDISACTPLGTTTGANGNNTSAFANVVHRAANPAALNVRTYNDAGTATTTTYFSVAVFC